ncbi:PREDICTED: uncharacterized protein LOC102101922 isoform X6 [Pseudopodoces humilis]|uniref:uncharacterized protein LOC102101922 isoform X6 n=1 Tax=Pseudopodoces humilis TaxID=181119 RepID=UPI0006B6FC44|nr:PREDICTED: uncharacterized protein LOC102101922 isoform X6 [Pseudopodoces humilis]
MEQKIQELEDADVRNWSKQQLSLAAERERILKQSKMQTELNWQQLCENAECNWCQRSEDLTQSLSSSKEEAEADLQKTDYRLHEVKTVLSALTVEREQTIQASFNHSISPEGEKQGPEPKVLEENMADFGQTLPAVGTGVGCQYSVKRTLQGMQSKLKEAARKISILSQEKRQLIEMGNRLRAELGMVLKEGLWHPVSSNHCTVCIASGSLLPRELVKRTECQLSVLKYLQHRLSTQVRLDFSIENHGPDTFSATKAATSTKIIQTQLLSQSPSQVQKVQLSSSSMHDFCQILDTGSSLSPLSPRKNTSQVEVVHSIEQSEESQQNVKTKDKLETSAEDLTVRGTKLEVQQKLKSRSLCCAYLVKPKMSSSMAKIRNYNIKD